MNRPKQIMAFGLVAAILAYGVYKWGYQNGSRVSYTTAPEVKYAQVGPDSIITSQQAMAVGEVTKKDRGSITVKGEDNQTATYRFSQNLYIYPLSTDPKIPPKPSTDSAVIKEGQKVQLILVLERGEYVITSISHLP